MNDGILLAISIVIAVLNGLLAVSAERLDARVVNLLATVCWAVAATLLAVHWGS